jgi:hypothetical protein
MDANQTCSLSLAEIALLRARRSYLLAEVAVINEKLANANAGPDNGVLDLSTYDPAWKVGNHLTARGKSAILAAFDRRTPQSEVSKLFRISLTAANNWHRRWKIQRFGDAI